MFQAFYLQVDNLLKVNHQSRRKYHFIEIMVSSNYSNYTLFGIKNEAERQTWAASLIFILICSVLGDTAIFVASIKYNAFKLHETIVVFIQHIAVCDLLYSLAGIFPRIVSMISDGWVFGTTLSYIVAHSVYIANSAGLVLICAMTSSKLWLLKYPLRSQHVSRKKGHVVCVFIWFFLFSNSIYKFDCQDLCSRLEKNVVLVCFQSYADGWIHFCKGIKDTQ